MAKHNVFGAAGETLAAQWLQENMFTVLHLNWRHSHSEVDIIAAKADVLHFIEVKTRHNEKFGMPEESVDKKKMTSLMKAAEAFQYQNPQWKRVQYDVLSITVKPNGTEYFFIEDVYL